MELKQLSIQQVLDAVSRGEIRIPAFQRGFVWEPDRVAYLMDSIYRRYPFGTLLFWRTNEQLKHDRRLGPLVLPDPLAQYPIEYVLDGQQRLTSVFCVFKTGLEFQDDLVWKEIYFDSSIENAGAEPQFVALDAEQVDPQRHFPLRVIFDSPEYRRITKDMDDQKAQKIDEMARVFQQVQIPIHVYQTDDKRIVSTIFERINRQGVALDTMQLLCAWTWSENFQLQAQFDDLSEDLTSFGFGTVNEDENLLLRCCAAIFRKDAAPETLLELRGDEVRDEFERLRNGVKGAVDFLRQNLRVELLDNLPFQTILVPLSVFFAQNGDKEIRMSDFQRQTLLKWFWRTCFSRRYSSGVLRNLKTDIEEMITLRDKGESQLGSFAVTVEPAFFVENKFLAGSVNTKTFVLMLAQRSPRSFISGARVDLHEKLRSSNRTEFHHLMPRAFLERTGQGKGKESILANMAFLSRSDNRQIGGEAPSAYRNRLPADLVTTAEILEAALIDESVLVSDNFDEFAAKRAADLSEFALSLI